MDPTATSGTTGSDLRWYQLTWLWVMVAVVAIPFSIAIGLFNSELALQARIVSATAVAVMGLASVSLWMGALVARRSWARGVLSILTLLVLALLLWSMWNAVRAAEDEALVGCIVIETDDGQIVESDPELCASWETFDSLERTIWVIVATTWVAPLFILYAIRNRFEPGSQDIR